VENRLLNATKLTIGAVAERRKAPGDGNPRWPINVIGMHLTFRSGDQFRAECLRYEAHIKAIDIVPEDEQMPPPWLTLTVTLMICYATIVTLGLLRAVDLSC
jgi:hypothetical protein